jgi:hypothetical protein
VPTTQLIQYYVAPDQYTYSNGSVYTSIDEFRLGTRGFGRLYLTRDSTDAQIGDITVYDPSRHADDREVILRALLQGARDYNLQRVWTWFVMTNLSTMALYYRNGFHCCAMPEHEAFVRAHYSHIDPATPLVFMEIALLP